jgi:hypothetical protein
MLLPMIIGADPWPRIGISKWVLLRNDSPDMLKTTWLETVSRVGYLWRGLEDASRPHAALLHWRRSGHIKRQPPHDSCVAVRPTQLLKLLHCTAKALLTRLEEARGSNRVHLQT